MTSSADPADMTLAASLRASRWAEAGVQTTCFDLWGRFRTLATQAESEGGKTEAAALRLLADLCGMGLDTDLTAGPFRPAVVMDGKRSLLPEDLTPDEVQALADFCDEPGLPSILLARLADVAWLRLVPSAPRFARKAIDAYRSKATTPDAWTYGQREEYSRAIQLCRKLGKDCIQPLSEIEESLLVRIFEDPPASKAFVLSVAQLLAFHGLGRTKRGEVARRMEDLASDTEAKSIWNTARDLFEEASKWFARANDEAGSVRTMSKAADAWTREAEFFEKGSGSGYMMAGAAYESAIQRLRSIPRRHRGAYDVDARMAMCRDRLRECNDRSLDAMQPFSSDPVDIANLVEEARAAVSGKDAWRALTALLRVAPAPPPTHWREQARKSISEHPLQSLFMNSRFSNDGRLIARSPGLHSTEVGSPAWNEAIEERAIQNFNLYQGLIVQGGILPALEEMAFEHRLAEAEFIALAAQSPMVPPGRERTFGRGLCAGYRRDFSIALHLIVPQIEHVVRIHVRASGGETRKLDESGVETELGLSALVKLPQVEKVFGETMAFELRAIFTDAAGPNLRNNVAHGLLDDAETMSAASVYAWWFALRLVVLPIVFRREQQERSGKE